MKKLVSAILVLMMVVATIPALDVSASNIVYSDHLTYNNKNGYDYDITDSVIAWVKQAKGALV